MHIIKYKYLTKHINGTIYKNKKKRAGIMENSSTPSVMVWSALRVLLVALIFIAPVFVAFSIFFWL